MADDLVVEYSHLHAMEPQAKASVRSVGCCVPGGVGCVYLARRTLRSPARSTDVQAFDEKNVRRRVYDALNVLMAMEIISKEKKEIRWVGMPSNATEELSNLRVRAPRRPAAASQAPRVR